MLAPINRQSTECWKADSDRSVDYYNEWFLRFAPPSFRKARAEAAEKVSATDPVGVPVDYAEAGIGFSLDLTEFTRDGNTLRFNMAVKSRQITGWKSKSRMLGPVFQSKTFHTTPDSGPRTVQWCEWNCLIPGEEETPGSPEMCIGPLWLFLPD